MQNGNSVSEVSAKPVQPAGDGLSIRPLSKCGASNKALSVCSEEEILTPRDHVVHARKTSSILHHPRLSPLDLCGCGSGSRFASFDFPNHHRTTWTTPLPPTPVSATTSGGFLQNHNKATFSSSGSLLGNLNGVPLFFIPSLSAVGDPLTGSLDSGGSTLSSNLQSPRVSDVSDFFLLYMPEFTSWRHKTNLERMHFI